ncbi:MAG: prepilin-type N-terminal cleavage/methylation domain-containing protein [Crocinitomicaceae bacterium]|jgi:prepilin-type N-terminal cleavage/methylation domain-containing protein
MKTNISSRKGFSLVEVVIAIGIVAVLLTTFMAVFGPAQKSINRALGVADANRLVATLENEMAILRPGEETDYDSSSFEKAFQWIRESPTETSAIVVYQYQALPSAQNADGTLQAADIILVNDNLNFPGVDYITQTVARRLDKTSSASFLTAELSPGIVQGKVYAVRMTQLIQDSGGTGLILGNPGEIKYLDNGNLEDASDSSQYKEGYITLQVEFFALNNNLHAYVTGGAWEFDKLGTPVATQNIAVRR